MSAPGVARRLGLAVLGVVLAALVIVVAGLWRSRLAAPAPTASASSVASATLDEAMSRLRRSDFGVDWTPSPSDGAILTDSDVLRIGGSARATGTAGFGLGLAIDGEASITLPGEHGPARCDAELDASDFDGSVISSFAEGTRGVVAVEHTPDGELLLRDGETVVASARDPRPDGPFVLRLTVIGERASASLDGERLVDARFDRAIRGACGLRFRGRGSVRVRRLRVSALAE